MLTFIPTPIGNTDDITIRGRDLLESLDIFFCEDTRTTKKLMRIYDIDYRNKNFYSITSFTSDEKLTEYIQIMNENDCGVVSEAGSPGLSDPGKSLVKICREHDVDFQVLPGANALIPTVVAACFNTSKFVYLGFLPKKQGRQTLMQEIINATYPTFVFESVYRIEKLLNQMQELGFTGKVMIGRELTKMYEQLICDQIETVIDMIAAEEIPQKGEFVVGFMPDS